MKTTAVIFNNRLIDFTIKYLLIYFIRGKTLGVEIIIKATQLKKAGNKGIILTYNSLVVSHRTISKDKTIRSKVKLKRPFTVIVFNLAELRNL
jgi:hypothetical protein